MTDCRIPELIRWDFAKLLEHGRFREADEWAVDRPGIFEAGPPRHLPTTWAHYGVELGRADVTFWAIEKGIDIEHVDGRDHTLLMDAVYRGQLKIGEALLRAGANPNTQGPTVGWRAIHFAAESDSPLELLRLLVEHGAELEFRHLDQTPLYLAMKHDAIANVKLLLAAGADYGAVCRNETVVELARRRAAETGKHEIVTMLASYQSHAIIQQAAGDRPLYPKSL